MTKFAVITGASQGIGEACAASFLHKGWHVINLSRKSCTLLNVLNFSVDLSNFNWREEVEADLIHEICNAKQICVVHNAGVAWRDTITALPAEQFRQVLEINVVAPSILNQILLPYMKPHSSIIYIGSTLSEKAVSHNASYIASKHAIVGLMKATCQDLDNSGIHTCCVCPGLTDTPMLRQRVNNDEKILDFFRHMSSAHRLVEPNEIASLVTFCAENPVINGSVLHAHLGQIEK